MKSWPNIGGDLSDYVDSNWLRENPVKRRLREETAKLAQAGMQISVHQGQQMALLARAVGARRAVEVGTFTGYSALCVAEALPAHGKLWCCDVSDEWTRIGRRYWKEAGVDGNKNDYDAYYERCLKLLRRGGLILIDNVLWGGSVVDCTDKSEDTRAIRALNAKVKADERVDLTLFAVGDGMTCALKR